MSTADDEPSSALNGRLRPRKSNVSSTQSHKRTRSADGKSAQDKPKSASPSASTPDDLTNKSELSPTPQFLCPYCDKKFASKQTVSKHARRMHFSSSKQDVFLRCLFCNHAEADTSIVRHMVDNHPNQYFACLDCHTRFPSTAKLAEHKLNICDKQKVAYRSRLRSKASAGAKKSKKSVNTEKGEYSVDNKELQEGYGFNGIVISCELKPSQVHDEADIEDNITTNLILPPCKSLVGNAGLEKNALIVLDDIQWNKRIPPNFSFHNTDHTADQILSRLGVVHRSPRTGEPTRRNWPKSIEDTPQKFEKCFDTSFYSKVASNVQENLTRYLDGSFNFNPDPDSTIKTRKLKNSVVINAAEGFPILLACEQYSRSVLDSYLPRSLAPKHKWKWDNPDNDRNLLNPDQLKRDSHVNKCIITLVSSLDIWTQLSMRRKFEDKYRIAPIEKKTEKQNIIGKELKEILESRQIPSTSQVVVYSSRSAPSSAELDFPASLGLGLSAPAHNLQPAVLSGEWVRPRCYVCCACGAQTRDSRALTSHNSNHHPNAQVQHYEIVGEPLLRADIMKHLYVPPRQICNRMRPPRGIKDCTKCGKSISLEDLHQHMLDCAGDTPTVRRRACRYRPFGVRRRRPRLPDNTIRKKIRKDIRTRQGRQKTHMRTRPRIRSEVGDAETIRKMLADLPAKRHRVMVNPMNMISRPRGKLEQQRSKILLKKRSSQNTKTRKPFTGYNSENATQSGASNSDDPNTRRNSPSKDEDDDNKPLRPRIKRVIHKVGLHSDALKRKTILTERKSLRTKLKPIRLKKQKDVEQPSDGASGGTANGPTVTELSIDHSTRRIDVKRGPYNTREQANRGGGNNRDDQQPGCSRSNDNSNNPCVPVQNAPLKHSIASLTANSETQDKAVQFHHLFLVQQECNDTTQHVPSGRQTLFENEAVVTKLDKPPLIYSQRAQADYNALQKNCKLNKPRKGLNDCIAMLKNKLVDPVSEPVTGHVSVQCGSDEPIGPLVVPQITTGLGGIINASPRPSIEIPHNDLPTNKFVGIGSEIDIIAKKSDTGKEQHSPNYVSKEHSPTCKEHCSNSISKQLNPNSMSKQHSPNSTSKQHSSMNKQLNPNSMSKQISPNSMSKQLSPNSLSKQISPNSMSKQLSSNSMSKQISPNSMSKQISPNSMSKQFSPYSMTMQFSPNSMSKQHSIVISKQNSTNSTSKLQTPNRGKRAKRRSDSNSVSQSLSMEKVYQTRGTRKSQRISVAQVDSEKAQKEPLEQGLDGTSLQKSLEYQYYERAHRKSIEELAEIAAKVQKPADYQYYERAYRKSFERNSEKISPRKSIEYQYCEKNQGNIVELSPHRYRSPRKSAEYQYYETKRMDPSPVLGISPKKSVECQYHELAQKSITPEIKISPPKSVDYHYKDVRTHVQPSPEIDVSQKQSADYLYCQIASVNPARHFPEIQISPQGPVLYQYCESTPKKLIAGNAEMNVSPHKLINKQYHEKLHTSVERGLEIEINSQKIDEIEYRKKTQNHLVKRSEIGSGQRKPDGLYLSPTSTHKTPKMKTSRSSSHTSRTNSESEIQKLGDVYPINDAFLLKQVLPSEVEISWRNNYGSLAHDSTLIEQKIPEAHTHVNAQANVYPELNVDLQSQPNIHTERDLNTMLTSEVFPDSNRSNIPIDIPPAHGGVTVVPEQVPKPLDLSGKPTDDSEGIPHSVYVVFNYHGYETLDLSKNSKDEDAVIDVVNDGVVDLSVKPLPQEYESGTLDLSMKSQVDNVPTDLSVKRKDNNISNDSSINRVEESESVADLARNKTTLGEFDRPDLKQSNHVNIEVSPTDFSGKISKAIVPSVPEDKNTSDEISMDMIDSAFKEDDFRSITDFSDRLPAPLAYRNRDIVADGKLQGLSEPTPSQKTENKIVHNKPLTLASSATETPSELDAIDTTTEPSANSLSTKAAVAPRANLQGSGCSLFKPTMSTIPEGSPVYAFPDALISKDKFESTAADNTLPNAESATTTSSTCIPENSIRNTPPVYTLSDGAIQNYSMIPDAVHKTEPTTNQNSAPISLQSESQMDTTSKINTENEIKNIDSALDSDPETAKKIALLPKELVEILGNMPVDHRNQLLNVLPQYVSTPTPMTVSQSSSAQTFTNTTSLIPAAAPCKQTTLDNTTAKSQTVINPSSIVLPATTPDQPSHVCLTSPQLTAHLDYDKSHSNSFTSSTSMSIAVKPQSNLEDQSTSPQVSPLPRKDTVIPDKEKHLVLPYNKPAINDYNHDSVIDLTNEDILSINEAKNIAAELSRSVIMPSQEQSTIIAHGNSKTHKRTNDQTASLRAVRIKAPSERHKESQILKRASIEQLSQPNINDTDVSEIIESVVQKHLAIQQAEVSSTQYHNKKSVGDAKFTPENFTVDLKANAANTETQQLCISTPEAIIENTDEHLNGCNESKLPKSGVVTSFISSLDNNSQNMSNTVLLKENENEFPNNKNESFSVKANLDDNPPPKELLSQNIVIDNNEKHIMHDTLSNEIKKTEFEEESDDDISLAVIVKQKKRDQQKISQFDTKVEDNVSQIIETNVCNKKKKKEKKHRKGKRHNIQITDDELHKINTGSTAPPTTVACSSSGTCETEYQETPDYTTSEVKQKLDLEDKHSAEKIRKNSASLNILEKVNYNLENDVDKENDTVSIIPIKTIEKDNAPACEKIDGMKSLKHGVQVDLTQQEISAIDNNEVVRKKSSFK